MTLRQRIFRLLNPEAQASGRERALQLFIMALIVGNVVAVILETVESYRQAAGAFFFWFEVFSVAVFTVEYILRLWAGVEKPGYEKPISGRLRFAARPLVIIDLLAVLPFYLPLLGIDGRAFRMLRLFRILRIVKLANYTKAFGLIGRVFKAKKEELVISSMLMGALLIISSVVIYYLEQEAQPEAFSSIPAAMWWSATTLTTVGYGDVYPITALGRFFAMLVEISSIGLFALPTGILGSGFVDEIRKSKHGHKCPHCGAALDL